MFCTNCGIRIADDAKFCSACGRSSQAAASSTEKLPDGVGASPLEQGDETGGLIPYKNPPALIGYYFGVFSLIPLGGLLLGLVAVPLGIAGLRKRRANPAVRGGVHAWVAIILGTVSILLWGGLLILFLITVYQDRRMI